MAKLIAVLFSAVVGSLLVGPLLGQASFTIRRLGAPGLGAGAAWDVNNLDQIVGELLNGSGAPQPIVWQSGVATLLGLPPGGTQGGARSIDDGAYIGGFAETTSSPTVGTTWQPQTPGVWATVDMGLVPGDIFSGVHANLGVLSTGFTDDGIDIRPVVWPDDGSVGNPIVLPVLPAFWQGEGLGVAPNGVVVGYLSSFSSTLPVTWTDVAGVWTLGLLPTLGVNWAQVADVVGNGHFVGSAISPASGRIHLVEWVGGAITSLGALPGSDCVAEATNSQGDIVGWARTFSTPPYVAIHKPAGQPIVALDSLLPPQSAWQLARAYGTNDRGVIVGTGTLNGFFEPFVMIPTQVGQAAPVPGTAGANNTIAITGAVPGGLVGFYASVSGGETVFSGCLEGLDLGAPLLLSASTANGAGAATATVFVPAFLAGVTVLLQAYDHSSCHTSNVVAHTF